MSSPTADLEPLYLSDRVHGALRALWSESYQYKEEDNALAPVCVADQYPFLLETQDVSWVTRFLPGSVRAWSNLLIKRALVLAQRATFSFDPMRAHEQLFYNGPPEFARQYDSDEAFAYRRIAGPNACARCTKPR